MCRPITGDEPLLLLLLLLLFVVGGDDDGDEDDDGDNDDDDGNGGDDGDDDGDGDGDGDDNDDDHDVNFGSVVFLVQCFHFCLSYCFAGHFAEDRATIVVIAACYLPTRSNKSYDFLMEQLFLYVSSTPIFSSPFHFVFLS